jgi:hypothetical protein
MTVRAILLCAGIASAAMLIGCEDNPNHTSSSTADGSSYSVRDVNLATPRTDGERIAAEGRLMQQKGEAMMQAEQLIADGKSQQARGQTLQDQGRTVEGARLIGEGEAKIKEGQARMDRANAIDTNLGSARTASHTSTPSTQPSHP